VKYPINKSRMVEKRGILGMLPDSVWERLL
jgi:hypothetical protein